MIIERGAPLLMRLPCIQFHFPDILFTLVHYDLVIKRSSARIALMRRFFTLILCIAWGNCFAQSNQSADSNVYDFLPRGKVIFEDDFSHDQVGSFPSGWRRLPGEKASLAPKYCQVQKDDDGDFMLVMSDITSDLEPANIGDAYLTDSFTLEYDFQFGAPAATLNIDFRIKHIGNKSFDWFSVKANGEVSYLNINKAEKISKDYPGLFDYNAWHHLAISNRAGVFNLYIDKYHLLTVPIYYGYPMLSFGLHCNPPVEYKNVRLATGSETQKPIAKKKPGKPAPSALKIYTNADKMSFTVNVPSVNNENTLITVSDIKGKKIRSMMTNTNTDIEIKLNAAPGIYVISAVTKNKTFTAKIALE